MTRRAARWMRSASATLVPPNFCTINPIGGWHSIGRRWGIIVIGPGASTEGCFRAYSSVESLSFSSNPQGDPHMFRSIAPSNGLRLALLGTLGLGAAALFVYGAEEAHQWKVHDMNRPRPKVITPGSASTA